MRKLSRAGRICIAAAASALSVTLIFALLAKVSIPLIGRPFLAVGSPLGYLILEFAPTASSAPSLRRAVPMRWPGQWRSVSS